MVVIFYRKDNIYCMIAQKINEYCCGTLSAILFKTESGRIPCFRFYQWKMAGSGIWRLWYNEHAQVNNRRFYFGNYTWAMVFYINHQLNDLVLPPARLRWVVQPVLFLLKTVLWAVLQKKYDAGRKVSGRICEKYRRLLIRFSQNEMMYLDKWKIYRTYPFCIFYR